LFSAAIFSIVASRSHSSSGTTAAGFPANASFANASTWNIFSFIFFSTTGRTESTEIKTYEIPLCAL
jgi:hypothetical protein